MNTSLSGTLRGLTGKAFRDQSMNFKPGVNVVSLEEELFYGHIYTGEKYRYTQLDSKE